ncbi:hypothetical protein R3W88_014473 [Solanum pinnatisectum]|uniref:Uncharacterized protein n=1 Tax=Solanum pinnatisectum TaxID=50273 RepID=A0AAV9KUT8_9SOLN|nr:hypothetical protein R3W88_014473 [Solanum pinnatisectum]
MGYNTMTRSREGTFIGARYKCRAGPSPLGWCGVIDEAQTSAQSQVHYVQILGVQHVVATLHLAVPPVPIVVSSMIVKSVMSSEEQKMLGRFIWLGPPRFAGTLGKDAHEFLVSCQERLHNLILVKSHGVYYITL